MQLAQVHRTGSPADTPPMDRPPVVLLATSDGRLGFHYGDHSAKPPVRASDAFQIGKYSTSGAAAHTNDLFSWISMRRYSCAQFKFNFAAYNYSTS